MKRWYVETMDPELDRCAPQIGIPRGPHSRAGIEKVIRQLKQMGYGCEHDPDQDEDELCAGDPAVLIWAEEEETLFQETEA